MQEHQMIKPIMIKQIKTNDKADNGRLMLCIVDFDLFHAKKFRNCLEMAFLTGATKVILSNLKTYLELDDLMEVTLNGTKDLAKVFTEDLMKDSTL